MKTRRNVYLGLGSFLVLINLLVDIVNVSEYQKKNAAFNIGYFIGSHVLLFMGLILLRLAYKVHQKIKTKEALMVEQQIDEIGRL